MDCLLCKEQITQDDPWTIPLYNLDGSPHNSHRECMQREVMGGIGHLIAHPYWCEQLHDPDAGLSRRHSALMVDMLVRLLNVDEVLKRYPDAHTEVATPIEVAE